MAELAPDAQRLADLLARSGVADRKAFAELYELTRAKLFAVSLRIVRERHLAEEVLQDSFVNIWNHAADYASDTVRQSPTGSLLTAAAIGFFTFKKSDLP